MERLILDVRLQAVGVQPKESIQDIIESDNEIKIAPNLHLQLLILYAHLGCYQHNFVIIG